MDAPVARRRMTRPDDDPAPMSASTRSGGRLSSPFDERQSFGLALLAALVFEAGLVLFAAWAVPAGGSAGKQLQVTRIRMLAPPPPPKPLPPPPKPVPPPPRPIPPPPKPIPPPKPPPPLPRPPVPVPPPKPLPKPRPRPVPVHHHIVHKPKPVPHMSAPPPPPQPAPQPAPIPAAVQESALEAYAGAVHQVVQADLKVPQMVEMMHLSGVTGLALRIAPDGTLLAARVIRSSGAPPIDRAALAAVRATHFPRFTPDMPHHPITVDIAVKLSGQ